MKRIPIIFIILLLLLPLLASCVKLKQQVGFYLFIYLTNCFVFVRNTGRLYCIFLMKEYTLEPYIGGISVRYK